jgi:hypothetical protein
MTKKELNRIVMEFAQAMDGAIIRGFETRMDDAARLIDEAASPFLQIVSQEKDYLLLLKRRVAESKFLLADEHQRPFDEVESHFEALRKLGFADLGAKVTHTIVFARYCLKHGNQEKALRLLRRLQRETNNHARFYQELKNDVDKAMQGPVKGTP